MLPSMFTDLVNRHDVGMVQIGSRLGLGLKPPNVRLAGQPTGENHLYGHDSIQ